MEYNLEQEIQLDLIPSLFLAEADHMPASQYLAMDDFSVRNYTVSLILQATKNVHGSLPYLAINYLDRFLSIHRVPESKSCVMNLIAVSCISLAMKMTESEFLPSMYGIEWSMVEKMEMVILGALKWRMRSITPFPFLNYFLRSTNLEVSSLRDRVKARAIELIRASQKDVKMLGFKPSIIAASAVLCACREVFPAGLCCVTESISSCDFVSTAAMLQCLKKMMLVEETAGSETPASVLEHMPTFDWEWEPMLPEN